MKQLIILVIFIIPLFSKDIVFGVVPQQSPLVLSQKWLPLLKELSHKTGHNIIFKTEPSIPKFEEALYSGKYDIAYMNPYHFVLANKKLKFEAIVRAKKLIQGIIVAKKSSKEDVLKPNDGKFLFPAPKAFAATLLTKYELKTKHNIDIDKVYKVLYVNSHDSVYKGIERDLGKFGGGIVRTFNNLSDKKTKDNLHIVYRTDKYPSHPIAVNPYLDKDLKKKLQKALMTLSPKILEKLNIKKIIETSNSEYDTVKDLAIKLDIY